MSLVKSALTYGQILLNLHNIGLSIQCVNSTTASGNQYIYMCWQSQFSISDTCMLAKPLHLYCNNFDYLSACWTSLCWPCCGVFGKKNNKKQWQHFNPWVQVDWFEDKLRDIHKKVRTRETIENDKEIKEYVEMLRSHRYIWWLMALAMMEDPGW